MPGSIQNAAPATVLPLTLSRSFAHSREYPVFECSYPSGESQRSVQVSTSRKSWRLSKRLTPAQLQALRHFYDARRGPTEPFWFYDPWETSPKFSHDPTGAAVQGRYVVRFDGSWDQSCSMGWGDVDIALVELA